MLPGIKLFDLHGRVAIVTGGSKGLGEAMAAGLASAGASLVIVSRKAEELEATAKQLAADYGQRVVPVAADVSKSADAKRVGLTCTGTRAPAPRRVSSRSLRFRWRCHRSQPPRSRTSTETGRST